MEVMSGSRRRGGGGGGGGVKASVVAGSVWESRMKLDEVKGGIKVFKGEERESEDPPPPQETPTSENNNNSSTRKMVRKGQGTGGSGVAVVSGKRKTWKSESFDGPIQIAKGKTESLPKKLLSLSASAAAADGLVVRSPPGQVKRGRSDGNERNPVQGRRGRSETKEVDDVGGQLGGIEACGTHVSGQESSGFGGEDVGPKKEETPPEPEKNVLGEENCEDKGNKVVVKSPPQLDYKIGDDDGDDEDIELDEGEEEDEEIEEIEDGEIKEIGIPEKEETEKLETIEVNNEPISPPEELMKKPKPKASSFEISTKPELKREGLVVSEVKRVHQFRNRTAPPPPSTTRQPPPVIKRATVYQNINPRPTPTTAGKGFQSFPETHNHHHHSHSKLQNLVDLVMWRDISRSAFVFGIGTFIIISSSYTKDLNFSFISVISYLGLVYLASIFLYRSLICREVVDSDNGSYVVGEDEAIWILKLVLPYLNECLIKIKALFSGDPATTMKLAVLLFVFARCGNSITIWKLAKLGFFGVFTVPKVCSSYSTQLTAYGKFWIRRFRDAWESCSHKKAVALTLFTLVWNFTSTVARVWAVFMMFVAVRYYQQAMELSDDWGEEEEEGIGDQTREDNVVGAQRQGSSSGPNNIKIPSSVGAQNINIIKANKGS